MNIFAKDIGDYKYLASQMDGMSDAEMLACYRLSGGTDKVFDHDFAPKRFNTDAESATAAFGLISNNLEAMTSEIEEILRERFKVPEFIPINTSIPEGATSYALRVVNRYGKGKFINKDGSNVDTSTASVSKMVFGVEYAGIQPEWSLQELRESLFTGVSLSSETLEAGTQGALNHIQDIAFLGDGDVGFEGLLNNSEVPHFLGTIPNFALPATTEEAMRQFVVDVITDMGQATEELIYEHFGHVPLKFVLPTVAYDRLANSPLGTDANKTIMAFLRTNNPWTERTGQPVMFESLTRCKDAGENGDLGRVVVYPMTNRILEMAIPIMPRVITTQQDGYNIKAPMEYSMSGVNVKRFSMMRYADGVLG